MSYCFAVHPISRREKGEKGVRGEGGPPGLTLREPAQFQDVEHEVSSTDVLHDKEEVFLSLEAGVEVDEEWRLALQCQHFPLVESALHIVLLHNQVLLETLDGIHLLRLLVLRQEHLHTV